MSIKLIYIREDRALMMNTFYGLTAVLGAMIAVAGTSSTGSGYLEYGALGLCGAMVYFLCRHLSDQMDGHRKEREHLQGQLTENTKKAIQAYDRLAKCLDDRPCLMKDKRIIGE